MSEEGDRQKTHWVTLATAITFFLVDVGTCIGHHMFLTSLNLHAAENKAWIGRYSLALAFLAKAALSAACVVAFSQQMWHPLYLDKRGVSIEAVDALFGVLDSPVKFFNVGIWRTAPVATLMATAKWLLPLAALVSPSALTVEPYERDSTISDCSVPTLDMTSLPPEDKAATNLALTTILDSTEQQFTSSIMAQRIVWLVTQDGRQSSWASPCGLNCTYEITFVAPI